MRDGTGTIRLRFVTEDVDRHGNVRVYVRPPGARTKTRLRATPGTEEFLAEYRDALAGKARPATGPGAKAPRAPAEKGTLRWLCEQYFGSGEFRQLDPKTQKVRRGVLEAICRETTGSTAVPNGDKRYEMMEPRHVIQIRDAKAEFPDAANNRVKFLNTMFRWAMGPVQHARRNPCAGVPKLRPKRPDGHLTWGQAQCDAFEATHPLGTTARLAYAIFRYTGLRRSDAVRLGRQHVRDGKVRITLVKGSKISPKAVEIPVEPELQAVLDASSLGQLTYLVTAYGKPFTVAGLGNAMRDWCEAAGLRGYSAHGLRKTVATELAEAGASEHELMATHGWSNPNQARKYTEKASRARLAENAFARRAEQKMDRTVPPESQVRKGGTGRAKNAS